MGQARTALSLTAAGSPLHGAIPLTLASAKADAGGAHEKCPSPEVRRRALRAIESQVRSGSLRYEQNMAGFINDKTEAAGLIFAGRHKILPRLAERAIAAQLGEAFNKALMMA